MIPQAFSYQRPETVAEAVALLQKYGESAKIISGGQSLIPMMKMRIARPEYIIDINHLPGLAGIREEDGYLRIGGLTREADLERSELVRSRYPILMDTAKMIADPLVRNLATVGGNLAHGDPANDHPATMLALRAIVVATGPEGERTIPVREFFLSLFSTALAKDEILTEIRIPAAKPSSGGAYLKLERKVGDYATAGAAAYVVLGADKNCAEVGIGLTNMGGTPLAAEAAETFLTGKPLSPDNITRGADLAAEVAQPSSDLRGPAEYKIAMVRELTRRALNRAGERAKG